MTSSKYRSVSEINTQEKERILQNVLALYQSGVKTYFFFNKNQNFTILNLELYGSGQWRIQDESKWLWGPRDTKNKIVIGEPYILFYVQYCK